MDTWLKTNVGQIKLNPDPPHGIDGQCVNLASSWSMAQGGPELMGDTAWLIWQNFRDPFYAVLTDVTPQPGDIAFFRPNDSGAGTGYAGHVDVVVELIPNGFKALDTDWNSNPTAQYINHTFAGVAGYFRPTNQGELTMTPEVKAVLEDLKQHILVVEAKVEDLKQHVLNIENK